MIKRAAARVGAQLNANAPALSAELSRGLPNPLVGGSCQAQATFMCTGEAQGERLNPLAMLKDSGVSTDYVPMCRACYDHLCGEYVGHVHAIEAEAVEKWEANQW